MNDEGTNSLFAIDDGFTIVHKGESYAGASLRERVDRAVARLCDLACSSRAAKRFDRARVRLPWNGQRAFAQRPLCRLMSPVLQREFRGAGEQEYRRMLPTPPKRYRSALMLEGSLKASSQEKDHAHASQRTNSP